MQRTFVIDDQSVTILLKREQGYEGNSVKTPPTSAERLAIAMMLTAPGA